ncbi:MAG: NlpC/P60 family protein [Carnobacterium sp.]|uniref:C40 family peptidase n=1 Tax=Carnobacterium sp. TaxID=48221 RepID=UPI003C7694F9
MNKKLLTLFLTATIGATTFLAPLSAKAEVENNVSAVNEKIQKLESEKESAANDLVTITNYISKNEENAASLMSEMSTTQKTLKELSQQIEELNSAIAAREEKLANQARTVQVNGFTQNYVDFLLESESFSDVLGRADVVSKIVSANQNLVKQQTEDKALVAEKQAENEENLKNQTLLAAKLEASKTDLMQQQLEKEAVVATIAAEKSSVENEKSKLLATKEKAENAAKEIAEVKNATVVKTSTTSKEATVATTEKKPEATPTTSLPVSGGSWGTVQGAAFGVQGTPYLYGGVTTSGFDCSGFTQYAFRAAGVSLPRTASAQYSASTKISQSQAKPGDLVFFNQTGSIDHVGIYLGNGSFIGAQSSSGVSVAQIDQYYWGKYVVGFGRVN